MRNAQIWRTRKGCRERINVHTLQTCPMLPISAAPPCLTEHTTEHTTRHTMERKRTMTYTTTEKRSIAEIRHKNKMAALNAIADAENDYVEATAKEKAILDKKVSEIETSTSLTVKDQISETLANLRTDEEE